MLIFHRTSHLIVLIALSVGLTHSIASIADVVSLATGGYGRGIRSEELMRKMTKGIGILTRDEWIAFHEKIFVLLDTKKTGIIDADDYINVRGAAVVAFATGGYARGLRTREMMEKIDTDGDGTISRIEFIVYLTKIFDMMDTSTTHKGTITKQEVMFATGGYNNPG